MLRFKQFIIEENETLEDLSWLHESDDAEPKKLGNNDKGVLHELLVGKHLLGGKHMVHHPGKDGITPKEQHDIYKSKMSAEEYNSANKRAKAAAEHLKKHIESQGHTVHDVHWTSKPGDLEKSTGIKATQKQDASDIVIHSKNEKGLVKHHGVSLKVTDSTSKHIGVSNPGMESMYGAHHIREAHKESINKQHPELAKLSNKAKRKEYLKALPAEEQKNISNQHKDALRQIAAHVHKHLENAGTEAIAEHIRTHVLQSHATPMQKEGHAHIRMTTHNLSATEQKKTGETHGHHIVNPHEHYEPMLKDHKNLSAHLQGTAVVFKYKGKRLATHGIKFNSQSDPHSSIVGNGRPHA